MTKKSSLLPLWAFSFLIAVPGYSQLSLVKDINPGTVSNSSSYPSNLVNVNGTLFFTATHPVSGTELWKSDGTDGGTVLVKDINPNGSSSPTLMTNVNGIVYFVADNGTNGKELWKSDGSENGTVMVKDIGAGSLSAIIADLTNSNGVLFFSAYNEGASSNWVIWKSDGTTSGTVPMTIGTATQPDFITNVNGVIYFSARSTANGIELWKTNGTPGGTVIVKDIIAGSVGSSPANLINVNGTLFFKTTTPAEGTELWKSDGTPEGTVIVKDINTGSLSSDPRNLYSFNNTLYFTAKDGTSGFELWKSDGTATGTVMVKDIVVSTESSTPYSFVDLNGVLLFSAQINSDYALFKTDGTAAGTEQISNAADGEVWSSLVAMDGNVYFERYHPTLRRTLWKSNGTVAGTVLVKDLNSVPYDYDDSYSNVNWLTAVNNTLFFAGFDTELREWELWKSDGTSGGTGKFMDINKQGDGEISNLVGVGDHVYFRANDGPTNIELWRSDGTTAGTTLVADINPNGASHPWGVTQVDPTTVYFVANDGVHGNELFKKEGSSAPVMVKDIYPGTGSGVSIAIANIGNVIYFVGIEDGTHGNELWRSDGTPSGTYAISNFSTNNVRNFKVLDNTLFFIAEDETFGEELWKSDGTLAGTMMVKDINPTPNAGSSIYAMMEMNGALYFVATDGVHNYELWKSDGTASGTTMVKDIHPTSSGVPNFQAIVFKDKLYFRAETDAFGMELWVTDGTEAGTTMVKDILVGTSGGLPSNFVVVKDVLYFSAISNSADRGLYKTDGTAAGTVLLKNSFRPSTESDSYVRYFFSVKDMLYILVSDYSRNTTEVWNSSGKAVCKLATKSNFYATYVYALGNKIFIGGESDQYGGRELFVYDATHDEVCGEDQTITFETLPTGKRANAAPFLIIANSTSGLPVSFTSSNPEVATISGNTVTVVSAGETEITATQAGDNTYAAATPVTQTLVVDIILGVEESDLKIASVYPNPFVSDFTLRIESPESNDARVSIFTTTGNRTEVHEHLQTNTTHALGSAWPSGFYIAQIEVGGRLYTRKIIKK
jgi:ELWxxDGT repeat protein